MILKYTFFALVTSIGIAGVFGSSAEHHDTGLEIVENAVEKKTRPVSDHVAIDMVKLDGQKQHDTRTHLGKAKSAEIVGLLEQDHKDNVKDLIKYRCVLENAPTLQKLLVMGFCIWDLVLPLLLVV